MIVKKCKDCVYCSQKSWHSVITPSGYHTIGIPHCFCYCELFHMRCLDVKKCSGVKK